MKKIKLENRQLQLWDVPLKDGSQTFKVEAFTMEEAIRNFQTWAKDRLHTTEVNRNHVVMRPLLYISATIVDE